MLINGKNFPIQSLETKTISGMLIHLKIDSALVAIECNSDVIDRNKWDSTLLNENDEIEIIKFVGGG